MVKVAKCRRGWAGPNAVGPRTGVEGVDSGARVQNEFGAFCLSQNQRHISSCSGIWGAAQAKIEFFCVFWPKNQISGDRVFLNKNDDKKRRQNGSNNSVRRCYWDSGTS